MLFLAQLVEPPLQPGPVRLPNKPAEQRRRSDDQTPVLIPEPAPPQAPSDDAIDRDGAENTPPMPGWRPSIQGTIPFSAEDLDLILSGCERPSPVSTLNACASALTARLIQDGYINSRVYVVKTSPPGALELVLGTISELRISSDDAALQSRVEQQLNPLVGEVLHLPSLEEALLEVRRNGVGSIKGNMGRLGSDPTKAVISLRVTPAPQSPLQGDLELSNSGNAGSGEWRATTTLLKNDLLRQGDTGLLFLELDADGQLELGTGVITSTYSWPLSRDWSLTGSLGYSYRRFVEFRKPAYNFSFRTLQGLLQLDTTLKSSQSFSWSAAAGISANRTDSFESGGRPQIPLIAGGSDFIETDGRWDPWTRTGYLKLSTNLSGITGRGFWSANLYAMQGLAGVTPNDHLSNLNRLGIDVGTARAIGGLADISWPLATNTTLNLRAAGQVAFNPLPGSMGFVLGSDTGLRGFPGSLVSGDSGWLTSGELVWNLWENNNQSLSLVPFIGMGGVHTEVNRTVFRDTVGSGGLIGRYRNGRWVVELGWVDSFKTDDSPGIWNDWMLGNGLYSNLRYRF